MSNIRKYLQDARLFANENFLNADGFIDDDMYFTADEGFFGADGNMTAAVPSMGAAVPQSQPYIITVSNASASNIANFDVLGAYQYLQNTGFSAGSLTISGVTISSAISNVNYQQFLYQSMNSPFSVGMTYFEAVVSNTQVTQTLTLTTQDANGNSASKTLVPTLDPYQFQTGIIVLKQMYRIDGFTKLTVANILPSAVFRLHFYPTDNINIARGLAGRPVSRQFGNPNVIKSNIAVVGGDTVKARLG